MERSLEPERVDMECTSMLTEGALPSLPEEGVDLSCLFLYRQSPLLYL